MVLRWVVTRVSCLLEIHPCLYRILVRQVSVRTILLMVFIELALIIVRTVRRQDGEQVYLTL